MHVYINLSVPVGTPTITYIHHIFSFSVPYSKQRQQIIIYNVIINNVHCLPWSLVGICEFLGKHQRRCRLHFAHLCWLGHTDWCQYWLNQCRLTKHPCKRNDGHTIIDKCLINGMVMYMYVGGIDIVPFLRYFDRILELFRQCDILLWFFFRFIKQYLSFAGLHYSGILPYYLCFLLKIQLI